ncbi:MAG: CBS domain-containing protein [Actinomycetota bacterium]
MGIGRRWKIATIRGVPLYLGMSWIWVAILYVWLQYARLTENWNAAPSTAAWLAVFAAAVFFGSVLLHEGAHAVMARSLGLPVLGVTLVFWGGATETKAHLKGARGEFLVAVVGPLTTLAVAGLLFVAAGATSGLVSDILLDLAGLNLLFAGLNALPGFPLDGGRVLMACVWGATKSRRTGMRAAGYASVMIGGAMLAYAVYDFSRGGGFWLFLGYVGFILISTGRAMDQRIAFRDQLSKGTVAEAMRPPPTSIPASMALSEALDHALRGATASFPVVGEDGRVAGTISLAGARRVGGRDPLRPVREAMVPLDQFPTVGPDEPLDDALEWLGGRESLVLRDGVLVGAIAPADIERWYRRVIEGRMDVGGPGAPVGGVAAGHLPPRPDV